MTLPPLYILRHGETRWNAEGRMQGDMNSPLTDLGRAQARAQGEILAQFDLRDVDVRVSPQARAVHTAAIALAHQVRLIETDMRLREMGIGEWAGRVRAELRSAAPVPPNVPTGPLSLYHFAPGGEGFGPLRARCEDFLKSLSRPTICVTHGMTSRMLRAVALGHPDTALGDLPGGQGVVHVIENGRQRKLAQNA